MTVAEVRVSPDLRQATAFVLPLGGVNTEAVVRALERKGVSAGHARNAVGPA